MKTPAWWLGLAVTSVGLFGCEPTVNPSEAQPGARNAAQALATGYRLGMTWRVLEHNGAYVHVGSDGITNPYQGDTSIDTFLPILCLMKDGRPAPSGISFDYYNGWTGGVAKLTPPIAASVLTSVDKANQLCAEEFGDGYKMAEFHDGGGGWNWWAEGSLSTANRFWVSINDQPANPWNSSGTVPPPPPPPKFFENENAVADRYIVLFPDSTPPDTVSSLAQTLASSYGGSVGDVYTSGPLGFVFLGGDAQARSLSNDYRVESVDQDSELVALQTGSTTQFSPPWGLDRVDQRPRSPDYRYIYDNAGAGVNVYVLDTGLRLSHQEFGGRATQAVDLVRLFGSREDCNGHGTAVASVIGGQTFGVAKQANLISIRVAGCKGTAYNPAVSLLNSTIVKGLDWVTLFHVKPAVANISYGMIPGFYRRWFGWKTPMDRAVERAVRAGVTVVVAAGNENKNAERSTPARARDAITVAATNWNDARDSYSNYGDVVDIFAPGGSIDAASIASDTATTTLSGTSLAAPFVAGAAALYLRNNPSATPAAVATALINNATADVVSDPRGSPNRLLHTRFVAPSANDVGVIPASGGCPGSFSTVTIYMDNEDNNQASRLYGWVGATTLDGNGNTRFVFCRVDGTQFHSLTASNASRANYAVLKLGTSCPAGSVEFSRFFDNEDNNNKNSYTGDISPNVVNGNSSLKFCLFKGDGPTAQTLPQLGFDYGVFAGSSFAFTSAQGYIYTDDEDSQNANGYSADPAWKSAATNIVTEGSNTTLYTARAAFPRCGDSVCNGVETDTSCAADCDRCGNGTCSPTENASTCAYDCGWCGDGVCGYSESAYSCSNDCGWCGDGICSPNEFCNSDCGSCTYVSGNTDEARDVEGLANDVVLCPIE